MSDLQKISSRKRKELERRKSSFLPVLAPPSPQHTPGRPYILVAVMASSFQVTRSVTPSIYLRVPSLTTAAHSYGRSPAYRRLLTSLSNHISTTNNALHLSRPFSSPVLTPLRSHFLPETIATIQIRNLHRSPPWYQERPQQTPDPTKSKPKTEYKAEKTENTKKPEQAAPGPKSEAKAESSEEQAKKQEGGDKSDEKCGGKSEQDESKKKEDPPPPPPHGDKTPWQVFMETMQTEFKASKEWNESTKQLADSAHQFTESESVRRARQAYESTTGAVSSTAGRVLKTSAGAIGKGAAWTWETPVMKGVRKGANLTGEALDKATKPIRETEAFKNVKNVIDDGSSSRYGGWVEKEERRKARELREKQAAKINGRAEDMVEDPK